MNWDAIGAIAELLGAIGVIASLVYLAGQIRHSRDQMSQNTRAMRAGTFQEFDRTMHESANDALRVPGLDRVVRLGMDNFDQLNEDDAFRFSFWMTSVSTRFDTANYLFREGMLDESRWQRTLQELRVFLEMPGVVQWWRQVRHPSLSPDFAALVEEILGEEAQSADRRH